MKSIQLNEKFFVSLDSREIPEAVEGLHVSQTKPGANSTRTYKCTYSARERARGKCKSSARKVLLKTPKQELWKPDHCSAVRAWKHHIRKPDNHSALRSSWKRDNFKPAEQPEICGDIRACSQEIGKPENCSTLWAWKHDIWKPANHSDLRAAWKEETSAEGNYIH